MMFSHYSKLLMTLALFVMLGVSSVFAQSEVIVEWADEDGVTPVPNALRDFIANDTLRPDDRVYVLRRGGFYWDEDRIQWDGFHLRIRGQEASEARPEDNVCGSTLDQDCGPAIIQRVTRADLSVDGVMLQNTGSGSHLTVDNVWFMGMSSDGNLSTYEQMQFDASDSRLSFNRVIFDRNDWHFLGPNSTGIDMFVTNSTFRNLFGPTQQWEGLGVRFESGADTVWFENNDFINIGFTPFQSEAAPMNFFLANHNTFVNVGRSFQAGSWWKEAYVANNIFVNPYWHGQMPSEYNDPDADDEFAGFFSIDPLPAQYGTDFDRRIIVVNNSYWRDEDIDTMLGDTIRVQPFFNDTTSNYFAAWDAMVNEPNYIGMDPGLASYPDFEPLIPNMVASIVGLRNGENVADRRYYYDPGRDDACFVCNIWPLPEDFTYSNATLLDGGTDGLALGNLNWYPDDHADYIANRDSYVQDIIDLAGTPVVLNIEATTQADEGTLEGDAEVVNAEGFIYYSMDTGALQWDFNLTGEGVRSFALNTALRGNNQRGQRIFVNGTSLRNDPGFGEFYWDVPNNIPQENMPLEDFFITTISQETFQCAGWGDPAPCDASITALNMPDGANTIRIESSWGYQSFAELTILDAGGAEELVLSPADAVNEGLNPVCDEADWCPEGFKSVRVGAGGSVGFSFDFPGSGDYMVRVFYNTADGAMGTLSLDGTELSTINFGAADGDLFTDVFTAEAGKLSARNVTLGVTSGEVNIDFVQLISFGATTAAEPNELPEGYALGQNYPNPFNPVTNISFTMADAGQVSLIVYDVAGREVARLVDGHVSSGTHNVTWDSKQASAAFASGVYFYRLQTPVGFKVRKMVLMK